MRGLNKAHKQKELKLFLAKNKIKMVGCLEIRIKEPRALQIVRRIAFRWQHCFNYNGAFNGRIWLL